MKIMSPMFRYTLLSTLLSAVCSAMSPPSTALVHRGCSPIRRTAVPRMGLFDNLFKEDPEVERRKEEQFREQQEILARRRNPAAQAKYLADMEAARVKASREAADKIDWQRNPFEDPLKEWKKRNEAGNVNKLGYEDVPKGGIQFPMASFGVGGEFGTGGKYDNGERFDLRLPYVEQGWVEESDTDEESVGFFENLLSGGRLQREADARRRQKEGESE